MKNPLASVVVAALASAIGAAAVVSPIASRASAQQGEAATKPTFGVCDVWTIAYELSRTDRFKKRVDALDEEFVREVKSLRERLEEIREKLMQIDADEEAGRVPEENPERDRLRDEYYELDDQYDEKESKHQEKRDFLIGDIMTEACELVIDAADEIAREQGFAYVFSSADIEAHRRVGAAVKADRRKAAAEQGYEPDSEDLEENADRQGFRETYFTQRFRSVAVAPEGSRIDDLIRDRLDMR